MHSFWTRKKPSTGAGFIGPLQLPTSSIGICDCPTSSNIPVVPSGVTIGCINAQSSGRGGCPVITVSAPRSLQLKGSAWHGTSAHLARVRSEIGRCMSATSREKITVRKYSGAISNNYRRKVGHHRGPTKIRGKDRIIHLAREVPCDFCHRVGMFSAYSGVPGVGGRHIQTVVVCGAGVRGWALMRLLRGR